MADKLHQDASKIIAEHVYEALRARQARRRIPSHKAWADLDHGDRYIFITAASAGIKAADAAGIVIWEIS